MASFTSVVTLICSIIFTPFLLFFCGIVIFATFGISVGFSRLYVSLLLKVFEYGRESIEKNKQRKSSTDRLNDDDDDVDDEDDGDVDDGEEENGAGNGGYVYVNGGVSADDKFKIGNDTSVVTELTEPLLMGNNNRADDHLTKDEGKRTNFAYCNGNCVYNVTPVEPLPPKKQKQKNGYVSGTNTVISRQDLILLPEPDLNSSLHHRNSVQQEHSLNSKFELSDVLDYIKAGVEAIIEDQVTSRFEAEELKTWNLLTRTNRNYEFINWKITVIWVIGFWIRYAFLLPLRVLTLFFGVMWLTVCTAAVGYIPNGRIKKWLNERVSIMCFQVLSNVVSCLFNYHNTQNKPKSGICVANHTSPIDVLVLACDNCYSLIGQRHGGFLGIFQRALARASPHIWFERSEVKDREAVTERLRQHISNPDNPPILIFPEGTCINNTSVMQFKKGSFEIGGTVYPVAIKYDPRFGDAFWNSSKYSMMQYLYMMMTSWAIVCEVWYLPPMTRFPDETAVEFANRVKRAIAEQGGLVDLVWDGQLKRMKPKKEWKERHQEEFSKRLKLQ